LFIIISPLDKVILFDMIANGVNDFLIKTGRRYQPARIKNQAIHLTFILLVIACALPGRVFSLFGTGTPEITLTAEFTGSAVQVTPYPIEVTITPSPSINGYPFPPEDAQPTTPVAATESQGTPSSQYPGPGEVQSSTPTPTQEITGGIPYPTPVNPVFLTSTSTSNLTYPGLATDSFFTPQATILFSTPQFGTPTAVPLVTLEARTPVPPPAWINSQLRASDLSGVKLASGKTQLFFFFAFWDGASLAMAPLVHAVEEDYQERVNFVYLDIDDPAANYFMEELGYVSQPHFFLVDPQGVIIQQWEGYVKIEELIEAIESALK